MSDISVDAISFSWAVDNAIRSARTSSLEASRVHSFASVINSAIRSSTSSNLGTSPVPSFASAEDNAMMTVPRRFASAWNRTIGSRLVSNLETSAVVAAQLFSVAELKAAANNFSSDNMIGGGRNSVVYRGKLVDGREVTIKRNIKKMLAFKFGLSEIAFLFRLRHKNLVELVGFCEEKNERLWVYEGTNNNRSLYYHLHHKGSSELNSWKMRIKMALDASRGIQFLHDYAVPSIIHGDIKSSYILLDATWTARVFDFEWSLKSSNVLTAENDVYGLGVLLLELLTGKKFVIEYRKDKGTLLSVVEFAVRAILAGDLVKILDPRVGPSDLNEAEAVELVANTATHRVKLETIDRPCLKLWSIWRGLWLSVIVAHMIAFTEK